MQIKPSRILFLLLAICCCLPAFSSLGRDKKDKGPHSQTENRFLFMVNISAGMKDTAPATQKAILELLRSNMQDQMREGDTFGIWTYNDKVYHDFPMQVWSEDDKDVIIQKVEDYLVSRRYEKKQHLERVLPSMETVIQNSRTLTVVFAVDGTEPLRGTPFDQDINDLHKEYGRELRAAHLPFITIIASRDGEIFDFHVNSPTSIVVPHTVDVPKPAETNAPPVAVAAPPEPVPAIVPPPAPKAEPRHIEIIMSGKPKPEAPPAPPAPAVLAATPAVTPPVPAPAEAAPVQAQVPPPATPVAPEPIPVVQPAPPPAPVMASAVPAAPPVEIPTRPVAPAPVAVQSPAPSAPPAQLPAVQQPAPAPRVLPQQMAIIPAASDHIALFIIALSLLTIAIAVVWLLLRRSRGAPQPSLISQSIDRR